MRPLRFALGLTLAASFACALPGKGKDDPGGEDSEADADTDSDADSDADGDTDADTDVEPTWTPVTINFDDCDGNVEVDERYPDVTFVPEDGYHLFCWDYASYSRSEPFTAYTATSGGGAGAAVDLTWEFTRPVRALQFYSLGDQVDGPLATVTVHTEDGGRHTTSIVGDGGASSADLTDLSEWEDIVRIEITEMEDPYSVNYDDISFERRD